MNDNIIPFPSDNTPPQKPPQTAAQINGPLTGEITQLDTADKVREKIVELFNTFKPALRPYYEYGKQMAALTEEFHKLRLTEQFSEALHEEWVLALSLDVRESPKSLDEQLAAFGAAVEKETLVVKLVVYDRIHGLYHIFI